MPSLLRQISYCRTPPTSVAAPHVSVIVAAAGAAAATSDVGAVGGVESELFPGVT